MTRLVRLAPSPTISRDPFLGLPSIVLSSTQNAFMSSLAKTSTRFSCVSAPSHHSVCYAFYALLFSLGDIASRQEIGQVTRSQPNLHTQGDRLKATA